MQIKALLSIFALASISSQSLAAPTLVARSRVAKDHQSCHAVDDEQFEGLNTASYDIDIGVDFQKGEGCDFIKGKLAAALGHANFQKYSCSSQYEDDKTTTITFVVNQGHGKQINSAMLKVFPWIKGGFNCPDY